MRALTRKLHSVLERQSKEWRQPISTSAKSPSKYIGYYNFSWAIARGLTNKRKIINASKTYRGLALSASWSNRLNRSLLFVFFIIIMSFNWLIIELQASSPACTELETIVMDWLAKAIGLPPVFYHSNKDTLGGGVIQVQTTPPCWPAKPKPVRSRTNMATSY